MNDRTSQDCSQSLLDLSNLTDSQLVLMLMCDSWNFYIPDVEQFLIDTMTGHGHESVVPFFGPPCSYRSRRHEAAAASHIRSSPNQSYFIWRRRVDIEWTVSFQKNRTCCFHKEKMDRHLPSRIT